MQQQQQSLLNDKIRQVAKTAFQLAQTLSQPPSSSQTPLSSSSSHEKPKVILPNFRNQSHSQNPQVKSNLIKTCVKNSCSSSNNNKSIMSSSQLCTQSKLKQEQFALGEIDFPAIISSSTGGAGLPRPYGPFSASRSGDGNAQWNRLPINFKTNPNKTELFQSQDLEFCDFSLENDSVCSEKCTQRNLKSRPQVFVQKGGDFCASFLRQVPEKINCLGIDCGKTSEFDFLKEDYEVVENPESVGNVNILEGDKLSNLFEMLDMQPNLNTQLPEELSLPRRKTRKGW